MNQKLKQILVIEDNEINQVVISLRLRKLGFRVEVAKDGEIGLQMIAQIKPDLVLLDINLPKMNGWEVAESVRSNVALNKIPIIALTALTSQQDREKAIKSGCNDFEVKPINYDSLKKKIDHFMK